MVGPPLGHDPWFLAFVLVGSVIAAGILAGLAFLATHEVEGATARWRRPGLVLLPTPLVVVVGAVPFALLIFSALFRMYGCREVVLTRQLLTVVTVLGPLRHSRTFLLAEVSNIRWRELRARTRRGLYTVRAVSVDVGKRTVDVETPLSFPDAHLLERAPPRLRGRRELRRRAAVIAAQSS